MRPAPRRWVRGAFLVWALSSSAVATRAHDLWVLPGKFHLVPGEVTRVFLNSGDVFPESATLTGEHRLAETSLFLPGEDGPRDVAQFRVEGKSLTFEIASESAGTLTLGFALRPRRVRLRASDFEDYLSLEALSSMTALREALGETGEAAVELYSKWAKAIVTVSDPDPESESESDPGGDLALDPEHVDEGWKQPIGHRLEIVPLTDPNGLAAGDAFGIRVLYEGEPVEGVPVVAGRAGGATRAVEAVTGEDGTVALSLSSGGRWYARALHMVRREDDPEVKWESFWCTLTFEVRP